MTENPKKNGKKNPLSYYARISTVVIQMGVLIALGAWGGQYLDERFELTYPVFTIILSLLGVAIGMYLLLKEISDIK